MDLLSTFSRQFGRRPALITTAPGRVNLLGEHVDYNEGPVLPAALDRSVHLAAAGVSTVVATLFAQDLNEWVSFDLSNLKEKVDLDGRPLPAWALYPAGVGWALQEAGYHLVGLQAAYTSDVPIGAGLSSSAAVEVAFAVTWQALGGWEIDRMSLARLCRRAENEYVGVSSGLMDQFASLHGVAGHALFFDTRSLEWEPVPMPHGTSLVIADSGVRRSLADSAYNERRAACGQAVEILKEYLPHICSLRDVSPTQFAAYGDFLPPVLRRRAEHVIKEIARVGSAVVALRAGETHAFGALMFAGHASSRDLYEVSCVELDILVDVARQLSGCFGARLTGAGFGGCTVNLVEESQAPEFIRGLQAGYQRQSGRQAQVYRCKASAGARAEVLAL